MSSFQFVLQLIYDLLLICSSSNDWYPFLTILQIHPLTVVRYASFIVLLGCDQIMSAFSVVRWFVRLGVFDPLENNSVCKTNHLDSNPIMALVSLCNFCEQVILGSIAVGLLILVISSRVGRNEE